MFNKPLIYRNFFQKVYKQTEIFIIVVSFQKCQINIELNKNKVSDAFDLTSHTIKKKRKKTQILYIPIECKIKCSHFIKLPFGQDILILKSELEINKNILKHKKPMNQNTKETPHV